MNENYNQPPMAPPGQDVIGEQMNIDVPQITSELFHLKLETDPTLQRIEENWRNVVWSPEAGGGNGDYVPRKSGDPWMNDDGINKIIGILRDIVHKEIIQSNLDRKFVEKATYDFVINIRNILFRNFKRFGVDKKSLEPTTMSAIVDDCGLLIYATMMRAENAGERKSLGRGSEVVKETIVSEQRHKSGLMPFGLFKQKEK